MAGQMQGLESRSRWVVCVCVCVCVYWRETAGGGAGLDRLMFRKEGREGACLQDHHGKWALAECRVKGM